MIHELGHAWGLHHEQVRADRNGNVTVLYQNMDKRFIYNFDQSVSTTHDAGYYDFDSIMHYGSTGFTRNGLDSMETVPAGIPIGQRNGLSAGRYRRHFPRLRIQPDDDHDRQRPVGDHPLRRWGERRYSKAFDWAPGSIHTVTAPGISGSADPRYVFVRWSDSPDASHTITAGSGQTVFCAIYQLRHRFSYDVGSGSGTVTASPAPDEATSPTASRSVSPPHPPTVAASFAGTAPPA